MREPFGPDRLQVLIDLLVSMLAGAGIPSEATIAAVERAYDRYAGKPHPEPPGETVIRTDKLLMGNVVSMWCQLPEYCDSNGDSLPLPLNGPAPSLQALLDTAILQLPSASDPPTVEQVEAWLTRRQVVQKTEQQTYERLLDYFPSSSSEETLIPMLLDYLIEFAHTAEYNTRYGGGTGRFLRVAQTDAFPVDQIPKINRLTHEHGMEFLRLLDSCIMAEVDDPAKTNGAETTNIGVGVYLFARDPEG